MRTNQEIVNDFDTLAQILSARYDIRVVFHGDEAQTNGSTIYLPSLPASLFKSDLEVPIEERKKNERMVDMLKGFLDHETAHIVFTDWVALNHIKNKAVKTWVNVVEDGRIEHAFSKEWRGSAYNFRRTSEILLEDALAKWEELEEVKKTFSVILLLVRGYEDLCALCPEHERILKKLQPIRKALSLAQQMPDTIHAVALGIWLAKATGVDVSKEDASLEGIKKAMEAIEKMVSEAASASEFSPSIGGMPKGLEVKPTGRSKSKEGEEDKTAKKTTRGYSDLLRDEADKGKSKEGEETGEETGEEKDEDESFDYDEEVIEPTDFTGASEDCTPSTWIRKAAPEMKGALMDENYYCPYSTKDDKVVFQKKGQDGWFVENSQQMRSLVGVMSRQLRMALLGKSKTITEYDKTFGTLNPKALPRFLMRQDTRVFKQKSIGLRVNARVSLLVDQSGSMGGEKIAHARLACLALGDFCNIMGIPFEVLGFSTVTPNGGVQTHKEIEKDEAAHYTRFDQLLTLIYKEFSEDWKRVGSRMENMRAMYENVDGESVLIAAKRLLLASKSNERKILIVLSDGQPAQRIQVVQKYIRKHLSNVVSSIEKMGVECVGIGIQDSSVKTYYSKHVVLKSVNDLAGEPIRQLREILLKN